MLKIKIAPSILSADFGNLNSQLDEVKNADMIHFDVMDGHFVPNITIGPCVLKSIKKDLPMDVHLMIENPENYIKAFADAGANIITVHAEACADLEGVLEQVRELGVKVGIAISPPTPTLKIKHALDKVDMVLVMSVNPGFGGQSFMPEVLEKVREIRQLKPDLDIQMDGGINYDTIVECVKAGANVLVAGSAIFKRSSISEGVEILRKRAKEAFAKAGKKKFENL